MLGSLPVQGRIGVQDKAIPKKEGEGKKREKKCIVNIAEIQWLRHVTDQKISSWGKDGEIASI